MLSWAAERWERSRMTGNTTADGGTVQAQRTRVNPYVARPCLHRGRGQPGVENWPSLDCPGQFLSAASTQCSSVQHGEPWRQSCSELRFWACRGQSQILPPPLTCLCAVALSLFSFCFIPCTGNGTQGFVCAGQELCHQAPPAAGRQS